MTQQEGAVRLAVDIGGTFTDVVLEKDGRQTTGKVLTTPDNPAEGFMTAVRSALEESGTAPGEVALILHGTTLATNALIERKGAKTALIVTEGHRDSLEIAYENRFDQYDILLDRPQPLVPRELRWPVPERMDARGEVVTALDETCIAGLLAEIELQEIDSLAIGLLHAYANPVHERRIAALIRQAKPELPISLSSEVCPEIREYERQSTTCANAYVQPLIARYLVDLERQLAQAGFTCPCLLMTSGGSLVTIATAQAFPVRLIESGPAGGAILASHLARQLGEDQVVSFDMGGTTAKICLIDQGAPLLSRSFEVDRAHRFMKGSGLPVKIPVVEMVEIGAGGGSIASVDALNRIQVGPESAGSAPGPACYGKGGHEPTVTDANLALGRLDAAGFAGGRMTLDEGAARRALAERIGTPLGLDETAAAKGVLEIVDENMASAARVHAVERGLEIEARTMIAFGGAAPLHAARLADKLGLSRVIVPANAGVGSAVGFLLAPVAYEVVRSRYLRLSAFEPAAINAVLAEMEEEARQVVALAGDASVTLQRHAFARYVGQGHEIKIALPEGALTEVSGDALKEAFEAEYRRQYARTVPGLDVEVLTWSLVASGSQPPATALPETEENPAPPSERRRVVEMPGAECSTEVALLSRDDLLPGQRLDGAAAIEERQTTTLVPAGFSARVNAAGDLILERSDAQQRAAKSAAVAESVRAQVIWDRLIAIVEEQAQALLRTAFSTTVREAGDLSAGVFDRQGRMLAQAVTGTPGHVNAMAASVGFFLEHIDIDRMREGDAYITNDPWLGTGHLFDFTVVTPAFAAGRAVGLFASTVHVVDIGGRGFGPDAGQVYEEGLNVPILPLFKAGEANETLLEIVRANVREPVQVIGDLYSLAACNEVGVQRLAAMMAEFALDDLETVGGHIVETSRQAMLAEIAALPAGRFANEMTVDGYEAPVRLAAALEIGPEGMTVDFDGSTHMSAYGINVPLTYAQAYASFGLRCLIGSQVPNNAGSLAPIRVTAPQGSILNAPPPAAVAVRHVIGQMLPDVVLGCLDKAVPDRAPAEGSASLWNPMLCGGHGLTEGYDYGGATPFSVTIFHSGGTGARPTKDGLSATAFPSGVRNTPVEITESIAPLIFHRKELRPGSGGAGRYRGGLGQVIEIAQSEGAPFAVFALFDRIHHPARGRGGGQCGGAGQIRLGSGSSLRGKGKQIVPPGDSLVLELPGGRGYGPPELRDDEKKEQDERRGLA